MFCITTGTSECLPGGQWKRNRLPMQETQEAWVQSLGQKDPLEEETGTHSSILAWKIPWTEEPEATVHRVARVEQG